VPYERCLTRQALATRLRDRGCPELAIAGEDLVGKPAEVGTAAYHGLRCGVARLSNRRSVATRLPIAHLRIDDAMFGHENAVEFYRTSAVKYLFGAATPFPLP
jgi:hypothetical protein